MKKLILLFLYFALPLLSGIKYVDDFEKGKMPNLLGGYYSSSGDGKIEIKYTTKNTYRGKYSLEVSYSVKREKKVRWICDLNGLDISKGKYFIFYMNPVRRKGNFTVIIKDLKNNKERFSLKFKMGDGEELKFHFPILNPLI